MLYVSPTRALRTMAGCIDESGTIVFIEANFNNGYINDFFVHEENFVNVMKK